MKSGELPPSTWSFHSTSVDFRVQWSWKRFEEDRLARESSESFHSLSAAMADARAHGFSEAHDKFSIR